MLLLHSYCDLIGMRLIGPKGRQISSEPIMMKSIILYILYLKAFPQSTVCINWVSIQSRAFILYADMSCLIFCLNEFVQIFLFGYCSELLKEHMHFSYLLFLLWSSMGSLLNRVSTVKLYFLLLNYLHGRVECSAVFLSTREQNSLS